MLTPRAAEADRPRTSPADAVRERNELLATSAAAWAALDAGVLEGLLEGPPRTPAELAGALELDARILERVLDLLSTTPLVERIDGEDGRFGPGPPLAALREHGSAFARIELAVWARLPAALRAGPPTDAAEPGPDRERVYTEIADDLARVSAPAARRLAAELEVPGGPILDVGCGAGAWSLALARAHPGLRVVGLDLPSVTRRFLARARKLGLEDRVEALPGDMHAVPLEPGAYSLVIAAHLLRLESRSRARTLLGRLARAVSEDGALLVIDAFRESGRRERRLHAAYRLHLALRNADGDTLEPATLEAWLRAEGLGRIERIDLGAGGLPGAVLARRD